MKTYVIYLNWFTLCVHMREPRKPMSKLRQQSGKERDQLWCGEEPQLFDTPGGHMAPRGTMERGQIRGCDMRLWAMFCWEPLGLVIIVSDHVCFHGNFGVAAAKAFRDEAEALTWPLNFPDLKIIEHLCYGQTCLIHFLWYKWLLCSFGISYQWTSLLRNILAPQGVRNNIKPTVIQLRLLHVISGE